jgi:hypothetical protein
VETSFRPAFTARACDGNVYAVSTLRQRTESAGLPLPTAEPPAKPARAHAARSGRQRSSRSALAGGAATIEAAWGVVVPSIIRVWVGRRQAMRRRTEFHLGTGSARRSIG